MRFGEEKRQINTKFDDMRKPLILIILICTITAIGAQSINKYQDSGSDFSYFARYPYSDVLSLLGNPDTILFCHYPLRLYEEKNMPEFIGIYLYRSNDVWMAATLVEYCNKKTTHWEHCWKLTKPLWVHPDLASKFNDAIVEIKAIDYGGFDMSTIHTWVYIKQGDIVSKSIIGNYRDFAEMVPAFSYVLSVAFLESYNQEIIRIFLEKY